MRPPPEPLAIGWDTIADRLDAIGWTRSAAMVRQRSDAAAESERWRSLYMQLRELVEPSAPREAPANYQPPPEASD